jgi:hypothetical protein
VETKTERVRFSDGRRGQQTRCREAGGEWKLSEVVITHEADGTPCRHVYGPRRYLDAHVYSFSDLGVVTWELEQG